MVERLEEMPPGTIGFRASGKVTREDYREILEPALREAVGLGDGRPRAGARVGGWLTGQA